MSRFPSDEAIDAAVEALLGHHPERGGPERWQAAYTAVKAALAVDERAIRADEREVVKAWLAAGRCTCGAHRLLSPTSPGAAHPRPPGETG